jgi:hypothetical protein
MTADSTRFKREAPGHNSQGAGPNGLSGNYAGICLLAIPLPSIVPLLAHSGRIA